MTKAFNKGKNPQKEESLELALQIDDRWKINREIKTNIFHQRNNEV